MNPVLNPVKFEDASEWTRLRYALWPEADPPHETEVQAWLEDPPAEQAVFVIELGDLPGEQLGGFLETRIRNYAEGCDTDRVGFIEGWYVIPELRGQGWGRALVLEAEKWACGQGCTEMASDTELHNHDSQAAHIALGYTETERLVCFRKSLRSADQA